VETADVVIAGGGIMGCALAYQLARRQVDVLLLERAELGSQSTGKCAGGVRQQFSNEANVRIMLLGRRLFEGFEEETGGHADFRQIGYLFVLTRPQDVETFHRQMQMWHEVGLSDARWVDAEEAGRLSPLLSTEDVLGCTFCPSDGIASPADVTTGYAAAARRHGARIREGVAVDAIEVAGGRVAGVRTSAGEVSTRAVFICAGAWSPALGRTAGVEIPVLPYRRHVLVTDSFPEISRTNPMTVDFATSLYFHPEGDGVLAGMSDRSEPPGFNEDVNWDFVEKMVEEASRRAPALQRAGLKTAWAGLYESTPDHQAILGPIEEVPGLWCACGFSGHGFMQGPPAGLLLSQLLLDGRSDLDLAPFSYARFDRGQLVAEKNVI
jgi:sarcosine oxidase subunit beta